MALESLYPVGVSQLSPSQALTVNEGYSFSREDPISLGIPEKVYPSLITRAYHGLSWDTPAGYKLSKAVPAVMWQMGIC